MVEHNACVSNEWWGWTAALAVCHLLCSHWHFSSSVVR